jgi:hypothetical protein
VPRPDTIGPSPAADGNPIEIDTARMSLRDNADAITARLLEEIGVRVAAAGVKIIESRLTRLAYSPEIAHPLSDAGRLPGGVGRMRGPGRPRATTDPEDE